MKFYTLQNYKFLIFYLMIDLQKIYSEIITKNNLQTDKKQQQLLQILGEKFLQQNKNKLWKRKKFHGLYIHGSVGTGKSTIIDLFFHNFLYKKQMMHFSNFMHYIHEELKKFKNQKNPLKILIKNLVSRYQLLVIDEFEIFDIANAMILGEILHEIIKNKLNLIIISNIPPSMLYKDGLQREKFLKTIELIEKSMKIFNLSNDFDYRRMKNPDVKQRFFINKDLTEEFAGIYQKTIKKIFIVQSRELILNHCIDDSVFLDFSEICESNLGSQDYEMIVKNFNTIYLSNIPIFNSQNQDYCARFIKFIDKIYRYKIKFFFSAKANLENIFQSGIKKNEFKRTLSRLIEMQADDY